MTSTYGAGPDPTATGIEAQKSVGPGKRDGNSSGTFPRAVHAKAMNPNRRRHPVVIPKVEQIDRERWRVTWPGCDPFECSSGALTAMVRDLSSMQQSALFRQLTLKRGRA
jgi:hypothetical protein